MGRHKKPGPKRRPPSQNKKITSILMPPEMLKALSARAARLRISRNKLLELISHDYLSRTDKELREMIEAGPQQPAGEGTSDLFG